MLSELQQLGRRTQVNLDRRPWEGLEGGGNQRWGGAVVSSPQDGSLQQLLHICEEPAARPHPNAIGRRYRAARKRRCLWVNPRGRCITIRSGEVGQHPGSTPYRWFGEPR